MTLTRREFVFDLGALLAAPPGHLLKDAPGGVEGPGAPFASEELRTLEAICEQIFPKDGFPGATELGVTGFLTKMLLEANPQWMEAYRSGLEAVRVSSRASHGREFRDLEFDEQARLLSMMEEGKLTGPQWGKVSSRDFFSMVRDHTLQGVYSHPRYGGNKGKAAWKMIGYDDWWA